MFLKEDAIDIRSKTILHYAGQRTVIVTTKMSPPASPKYPLPLEMGGAQVTSRYAKESGDSQCPALTPAKQRPPERGLLSS